MWRSRSGMWNVRPTGTSMSLGSSAYDGMWGGVPVFVARDKTAIALFPAKSDHGNPPASRKRSGMLHLALRANRKDFVAAQRGLTDRGITFHFQDHEISQSIYFRDPDGIELEITTYELE